MESLSLSKKIILKLVEIEVEKWFWIRQAGWDVDVIRDRRFRSEQQDESRGPYGRRAASADDRRGRNTFSLDRTLLIDYSKGKS